MLVVGSFQWILILLALLQIGIYLLTSAGLLAFGMITAGFIKQMENLETEIGDELVVGRKCLEQFQSLKKGLGPYLFAEFSVNTFSMVVLVFLFQGSMSSNRPLFNLLMLASFTLFAGVKMLYISLVAEETKSKLGNILPFLR